MDITRDDASMPVKIRMLKPMDGHLHLRQGAMLQMLMPMVMQRFHSGIVMPNITPVITTAAMMKKYEEEIREATPTDQYPTHSFAPEMTMYLTDKLDPRELEQTHFVGLKYYPRGLTTNSDSGVKNPADLWTRGTNPYECLRVLSKMGYTLMLHAADGFAAQSWGVGERSYRTGDELDPYDQELHFILHTLPKIQEAHPKLKISVEHLSTNWGVEYMRKHGGYQLGCSITAQHLLLDRRDSFRGGFRPDRFWWPIIQPKEHRDELRRFVTEQHPYAWLGSDSAPHPVGKKYADCCTGGVMMVHAGIELYVEAFEDMGCLDYLESFACRNAPQFFKIPDCGATIELVREEWKVEKPFFAAAHADGDDGINIDQVVPFRLGEKIRWKLAS